MADDVPQRWSQSTEVPDMWVDPGEDQRDSGETQHGERAVVLDYLRAYRLTLEMKCDGLDSEQLSRRSVPPSTMSLLGLVRHLTRVEHSWARRVLEGHAELPVMYRTPEDDDADFTGAVPDDAVVAGSWRAWQAEVEHFDEVLAGIDSFDTVVETAHGDPLEVRDVVVHMVEEYARHCGHADLLRECIDGRTGQ